MRFVHFSIQFERMCIASAITVHSTNCNITIIWNKFSAEVFNSIVLTKKKKIENVYYLFTSNAAFLNKYLWYALTLHHLGLTDFNASYLATKRNHLLERSAYMKDYSMLFAYGPICLQELLYRFVGPKNAIFEFKFSLVWRIWAKNKKNTIWRITWHTTYSFCDCLVECCWLFIKKTTCFLNNSMTNWLQLAKN